VGTDPAWPSIVGYAAVYFNPKDPRGTQYLLWEDGAGGRCYERIAMGAFARALADRQDVVCLWNHNPDLGILGRTTAATLTLSTDNRGLRYTVTPPDAPLAQGVIANIDRRECGGSSFSFIATRTTWFQDGNCDIRQIDDCDLIDVSPVCWPAYRATSAALRAEDRDRLRRERDAHRASRERGGRIGLSRDAIMATARLRDVELALLGG
jgi:HK97 family phage prohead protease